MRISRETGMLTVFACPSVRPTSSAIYFRPARLLHRHRFHFTCVGLTDGSAAGIEAYSCDMCEQMGMGSTRSESSFLALLLLSSFAKTAGDSGACFRLQPDDNARLAIPGTRTTLWRNLVMSEHDGAGAAHTHTTSPRPGPSARVPVCGSDTEETVAICPSSAPFSVAPLRPLFVPPKKCDRVLL